MSQTQTAEKKTIDLGAMEGQAGMITSELLEWGLYVVLQTFDGTNWSPSDAGKTLKDLRDQHGEIPEKRIPTNPLADFAEKAGLSAKELNELALLSVCDILDSSEFPDKQPCHLLADARREMGTLLPHFLQDYDEIEVHPFMAALFSGELSAAYVPPKKHTNAQVTVAHYLDDIFEAERQADDLGCQVQGLYDAVQHNPELKQEAAAMNALSDALNILQKFIFSTR